MEQISTVGLDLAKSVFQVHGVGACGTVVLRKQLRRAEVLRFFGHLAPCLVGMEACGSAHYWARELTKLGHQVKLMPPVYVKPYVKRGKTDAGDAEAIAEAVTRPSMHFVPIKSVEQQAMLMLHKTRDLFARQRTMLINAFRAHPSEFGLIVHRERVMRGSDRGSGALFSYVDLEARVRRDHPLRLIREIVNAALIDLSADFEAIYAAGVGRPSIPPERLLRALLLQAFYGIRSERQIMERLEYDLLFRCSWGWAWTTRPSTTLADHR